MGYILLACSLVIIGLLSYICYHIKYLAWNTHRLHHIEGCQGSLYRDQVVDAILLLDTQDGACCLHVLRHKLLMCGLYISEEELQETLDYMEESLEVQVDLMIVDCEEEKAKLN